MPYPLNVNMRGSFGNSNKHNYDDTQYRASYRDTGRNTYSIDSVEGKVQVVQHSKKRDGSVTRRSNESEERRKNSVSVIVSVGGTQMEDDS